jgi:hypothetical protein
MHMDPLQLYHFVQLVGGLLLLGWIAALAWRWSSRTATLRYELRSKVLDRFSSEEFVALLRTEEGRRWMADVLSGRSDPQEMVDAGLRQAIVLTFLGLGLLAIAKVVESRFLLASGILIVSGAAGLWVATWVVARRRRTRREIEPS